MKKVININHLYCELTHSAGSLISHYLVEIIVFSLQPA